MIVTIVAALAQVGIQPARALGSAVACDLSYPPSVPAPTLEVAPPTAKTGPVDGAAIGAPRVIFTIPLATFDDVRRLDQRPEIADILKAARRYSDSRIDLAAYVTADDVPATYVEASGVAEALVIEVGIYLVRRGVEAERISGKGMGIDSAIGRAVVVSFDITRPGLDRRAPARKPSWPTPTDAAAPFLLDVRDSPYGALMPFRTLLRHC